MAATVRKYTLVVRGDDNEAADDALAEAVRLMKAGNMSGANSNDTSGFYFDSTDEVPPGEWPA